VDLGTNVSTSRNGPYANAPAAYAQVKDSLVLDQATFYIERVPDTVQTDHFDWGFRLTNLYGFDYRFTTASPALPASPTPGPKAPIIFISAPIRRTMEDTITTLGRLLFHLVS
jgi:hypothetical protein